MDTHPGIDGAEPTPRPASSPEDGEAPSPLGHASQSRGLDDLRLLAINHRSASLSGFERAALAQHDLAALHGKLEAIGIDSVVLATCNRIELYWRSVGPQRDAQVQDAFRAATGAALESGILVRASGEQVAQHLFRVACGLDSLLLGEGEILGQVRNALDSSGADDLVSGVFRAALRCGGSARAETAIGSGALSIASAGAQLVAQAIAKVERPHVVIVGAGETGRIAARHLCAEGVERVTIVNRTYERAVSAAGALGVEAAPLAALPELLRDADGVIVAVHAPAALVTASMVHAAMTSRPQRELVVSDLSMPRAVETAVRTLPGLTLHDMLGLESLVRENRLRREREIPRVEAVIQRELEQLRAWAHQQLLRPMMAEFRERAEAIRVVELRRMLREDLTNAEVIDRLTRRLVERLITIPIATMRESHPKTFDSCGMQCMRRHQEEPGHGHG